MKISLFPLLLIAASNLSAASPPVEPWKGQGWKMSDLGDLQGISRLTRDRSGKLGDPPDKYFHESTFHPHYDGRFADKILSYDDRRNHLSALVQTYLSTMHDIGAETWIMHGSLLGWWWNRKIMPWDSDLDVQMSERSMAFLADYYNYTIHTFKLPGLEHGRNYMLEINPHYKNDSITDKLNVIDGRWIDTDTGLFIDITTLRRNRTAEAEGRKGVMMCKDKHHYMEADIFPLRDSVFEGIPVKVPYAYSELLEEEYGKKSLTTTNFEHHHFDEEKMEWIPMQGARNGLPTKNRGPRPHHIGANKVLGLGRKARNDAGTSESGGSSFAQFGAE